MYMWREFDSSVIKDDLAKISELGLSSVRIFLLWEDFQPRPRSVPTIMLDRLVNFLEMAADSRIEVMPTLFTGHMSGLNWLPPWMLLASTSEDPFNVFSQDKVRRNKPKNPYVDPEVMESQIFFLRELTSALCGHPALNSWDLGNRPSLWAVPPTESAASLWLQAMTETLKERDDAIPVTLAMDLGDLTGDRGIPPRLAARYLDYLTIHVQPCRLSWAEGPQDAAVLPFVTCLTGWLAKKPILIQGLGVPTLHGLSGTVDEGLNDVRGQTLVSEEEGARFAEQSLSYLRRFNAMGAFWTCFGDYHPSTWNWPPLNKNPQERYFGLIRHDGSRKPAAALFRQTTVQCHSPRDSSEWIDLSPADFYEKPKEQIVRLYRRFREYYDFF